MQHHAYFYEGSNTLLLQLADSACKEFSFERGMDVYVRGWEKFGIDESRELVQLASLKSASGRALFVLGISSTTGEAQQALLKLFEEPQKGVVFVLLVPHGTLLPTLKSRMLEYPKKPDVGHPMSNIGAGGFLSWPYKQRSDWIAGFLNPPAGGEEGVRERVREFVNGLEVELYKHSADKEAREGLQDIAHFRQYFADRSPSLKMILEHFAATLPTIK